MLKFELDLAEGSYNHVQALDDLARSFPFYVTECGRFNAGKKYFTKRDGLCSYLLIVTVSGSGYIKWRGEKVLLGRGDSVVVDCRDYQEYGTQNGSWDFYFAHFGGSGTEAYEKPIFSYLRPVKTSSPDSFFTRLKLLSETIGDTSILTYAKQSHAISGILTEMMACVYGADEKRKNRERPDIRSLADYIKENCTENLDARDFSEFIRLSGYHMCHLFAQQIGMPPYRYMHKCRITRAQELIRNTNLGISEIAEKVGYSNYVMFGRHFKRFTGISPQ